MVLSHQIGVRFSVSLPEGYKMKITFVFDKWEKDFKPIDNTEEGIDLSMYGFHSGTVFDAEIQLNELEEDKLKKALKKELVPFFYIIK